MFDVSFTELMVVGVIALIVIGPEREIEIDELRKFKSEMEDAAQGVQQSLNETQASLQEPVQQFRAELDEVAREANGKVAPVIVGDAPAAGALAEPAPEPARTIAPPGQSHNLDLDLPPASESSPAAPPASQPPAPAPRAPKADDAAPAAKPVPPSGTPT
jgi:sec-independent protein translocase protein TatB